VYVHLIYFIPLCVFVYLMKKPFSYAIPAEGRDAIVDDAWEYMPLMMVSCLFAIQLECAKAYLLAYEVTTPFTFIHFTSTLLHIFWCWLLIYTLGYGIIGAGIAIVITEVLTIINIFSLLILYCL
jgi:Na+-driven multidrug efflux pump